MRLLLAEDDTMIGEAVRAGLRRDGFTVDWVRDGTAAAAALAAGSYVVQVGKRRFARVTIR